MGLKEKSKYEDSYEFSNHEGQQYVSFKIAEETYMVDIKKFVNSLHMIESLSFQICQNIIRE